MQFSTYFRLTSYATIAAATLALFMAGGVGVWLVAPFAIMVMAAWKVEGTRWQLSERAALIVILTSLPVFYFDWRVITPLLTNPGELGEPARGSTEVAVLAHLILFLSVVKLWQRKSDRDWFFLYLISFFEVLLAAGLTASPAFLATLIAYLLCALSTVVAFEIHKAHRKIKATQTRLLVQPDSTLFQRLPMRFWRRKYLETRRLPVISAGLLVLIVTLALPFFLLAPRTTSSALKRGGAGVSGFIGFSDNVRLGEIGTLKGNDEIFMHVRVEAASTTPPAGLRWRGVALDEFTGKSWKKSRFAERWEKAEADKNGLFKIGTTADLGRLTAQTYFLEPVDTPVLFGAPRIVGVQGGLPFVRVDAENSIQTQPHDQERVVYKIFSDTTEPGAMVLRADPLQYPTLAVRYLQLPATLDPRIGVLANSVTASTAPDGYDKARAIESYLRDSYAYSLDLKATGEEPLSDFLFRVQAGHCEYFATAMAVMLRTQGIASRIVNGFLPGEYNDAAAAYTVRQSDAHSWVEVYFPKTSSWVTFDPTPPAGRTARTRTGLAGRLSKYSEALELMWFQYVVGYDKQEQKSLVTTVRKDLLEMRRSSLTLLDRARVALPVLLRPLLMAVVGLGALILALFLTRRVRQLGWRRGLRVWQTGPAPESSPVDFYERLIALLEKRGIKRESYQTPLEFAAALDVGEARVITNAYNRVRFAKHRLSDTERRQIEDLLSRIEQTKTKD
jgi:protein-glutamine gamma-glutamyltransferase